MCVLRVYSTNFILKQFFRTLRRITTIQQFLEIKNELEKNILK